MVFQPEDSCGCLPAWKVFAVLLLQGFCSYFPVRGLLRPSSQGVSKVFRSRASIGGFPVMYVGEGCLRSSSIGVLVVILHPGDFCDRLAPVFLWRSSSYGILTRIFSICLFFFQLGDSFRLPTKESLQYPYYQEGIVVFIMSFSMIILECFLFIFQLGVSL